MHSILASIEVSLQPVGRSDMAVWLALAGFVLIVGILTFSVRLLRKPELTLVSRNSARILLLLRGGILGLLVLLLLFQPQFRNVIQETIPSHVLVALDTSGSMNFADAQISDREALELAVAVGLKVPNASSEQLQNWLKQYTSGNIPNSVEYRNALKSIHASSRAAIAQAVLKESPLQLLNRLKQDHEVRSTQFSDHLEAGVDAKTNRGETNINLPLQKSLREANNDQERCVGVVLLTDGRQTSNDNPLTLAAELKSRGVPVYPLVIGSPTPIPDLSLTFARAIPAVAFQKSTVRVEVKVRASEMPRGKIRLELTGTIGEKKPRLEHLLDHAGGTQEYDYIFELPGEEPGSFVGEVRVDWTGPEKEAILSNNQMPVRFQVVQDKARVLFIDSEMRYESHYLQTALLRDESIQLKTILLNPPRIGALTEEGLKEQGYADTKIPADFAELMSYDCLIIGDVDFRQLDPKTKNWLERYLTERGGTVVLVAGKKAMPMGARSSLGEPMDPVLERILPIMAPREIRDEEGFSMQLTSEGQQRGYLQLDNDIRRNDFRWQQLPRSYWGVVGKCKPSAISLAYVMPRLDPAGTNIPKLDEIQRNNAILVRQNIGFGKVLFLGIDSTWRWRYREGDATQFRFWGQLIRWAASDRPLSAGNEFLRFGVREPLAGTEQPPEIILRLTEVTLKQANITQVRVRVNKAGEKSELKIIDLKQQAGNPREWRAPVIDLPVGKFEIEPLVPELNSSLVQSDGTPLKCSYEVFAPIPKEDRELSADFELMKTLAESTGGNAFWAKDADQLPALLKNLSATRETVQTWNLADSWWLFGVILFLLTVEWSLRKWLGLA
ncbi:hypothetical protein KIH39_12740 [Telmatocola sphagniphila]|uniref:VWFA domain-containing protein n=1 Tax=Telmatocola sphagniphila TaxID=1123043 RepID=A0A8E6BBB8_9BACT|nr:hypothetical protein [Telmatocola sphagniphila]QVL34734.1 hypothetical protein KIH39_12740 [Telmatocola sphagniphila]